jgi:hypothetical protein
MMLTVDREDEFVVDVLPHINRGCSSRRQHDKGNSDEPSHENVFQSHMGVSASPEET